MACSGIVLNPFEIRAGLEPQNAAKHFRFLDLIPLKSGLGWNRMRESVAVRRIRDLIPLKSGLGWNLEIGLLASEVLDLIPLKSGLGWNPYAAKTAGKKPTT